MFTNLKEYFLPLSIFILLLLVYSFLILFAGHNPPFIFINDNSMTHYFNYDSWLDTNAICNLPNSSLINCTQENYLSNFNISKRDFLKFPFSDGITKNSLLFFYHTNNLVVGDIIVLDLDGVLTPRRLISTKLTSNGLFLSSKADNDLSINTSEVVYSSSSSYLGKVWLNI